MAPLILEFKKYPEKFVVRICLTGQHKQMLDPVNDFFGVAPDCNLELMQQNQTLTSLTSRCLLALDPLLIKFEPDILFVQGDTTTVLAAALAAYYRKIPVAHLEAGLRSGDKYSPFPEELNRKITSQIAEYHFAPTARAADNLKMENITKNVYVVGNTVIDALHLGLKIIRDQGEEKYRDYFSFLDLSKKIVLVTGHRRESFGEGFDNICNAIRKVAKNCNNIEIVYPVHMNPNVREPVSKTLTGIQNIHLIEPLDYPYLLWLMEKCSFVLTDSGGIQEEAPALGKPVLVMRTVTERVEGIEAGTAKLVGTNVERIYAAVMQLLTDESEYEKMAKAINPYGNGDTSRSILKVVME